MGVGGVGAGMRRGNGECLGDEDPALQLDSEHLQTGCQGPGKYQMWSEKQCSEANDQECWGSKIRALALEERGNLTRRPELSC